MAVGGHFGCSKITFDRIYRHFRFFFKFLTKWISENHFWSDFSPFHIDTQFLFLWFGCHFRSIRNILGKFLTKWHRWPFWMSEIHFQSHFWTFSDWYGTFWQNDHQWPYWMSENHFRSHFWSFHINTELVFVWIFFTKWHPEAILDGTTMPIIELVRDIWVSNGMCQVWRT